jgi:hypothetical protein
MDPRKPKPPAYVKMPGRPRKERRREQGEPAKTKKLSKVGIKVTCSNCKKQITTQGRVARVNPKKKHYGERQRGK